ncbi:PREDICTED: glucose transporter type 1-like [Diuraphis noxia]|uniref:glucose transporter type 1-like n=1 Tax=Diuraphis noxia TaxID=143948 RepID=UPI0007638747|nr:PREDICTED: glucose transporter type 1-like [Diuraphis noxia]
MLGMLQFGYNTGVINAPEGNIEKFIKDVFEDRYKENMDHGQAELLYSFAVSIFAIGGMLGGFSGGIIANRFGRQTFLENVLALRRLRATNQIEEDIEEMRAEERAQQSEATISMMELVCSPTLRQPLIISVVMQLSQQLSGINAVFYYSTSLFITAGLAENVAKFVTIGIGVIMVNMTLVTMPLMDKTGRRTLHLYGLGGMFIFSIFITISLLITVSTADAKICTKCINLCVTDGPNVILCFFYLLFHGTCTYTAPVQHSPTDQEVCAVCVNTGSSLMMTSPNVTRRSSHTLSNHVCQMD